MFCRLAVFFFFKQKTAYEMRISDWSSDVCSSDLIRTWPDRPPNLPPLMANALAPVDAAHADFQGNIRFLVPARATRGQEEPVFANIPIDTFALPMDADMRAGFSDLVKEIGRASCRERVCQYV